MKANMSMADYDTTATSWQLLISDLHCSLVTLWNGLDDVFIDELEYIENTLMKNNHKKIKWKHLTIEYIESILVNNNHKKIN